MLDLGTLQIHIEADTKEAKKGLSEFESETKKTESSSKRASEKIKTAFASIKTSISGAKDSIKGFRDSVEAQVTNVKTKIESIRPALDKVGQGFSKLKGVGVAALKAVAAGAVAAAAAAGGIVKQSFDAASQFEQLAGGTEKLFGKSSKAMMKYADEAYRTVGMSKNQYLEQANSLSASMIKSLGGDAEKAAKQTDKAMRVISDNASVFGTDMESVQNAFQGFAKENYTMLDNLKLGYGGSKEGMEQLLADAEKLSGIKYDISSLSDITDAIQVIQEKQGIAGNAEAEANKTVAGSIQMLQASYQNWLTDLSRGDGNVKQSTQNLVKSFGTAAKNVIPLVGGILSGLLTSVPMILSGLGGILNDLFANFNLIDGITSMLNGAVSYISQFDLAGAASSFVQNLSSGITVEGVAGMVQAGLELAGSIIKGILDFVTNPDNWLAVATAVVNAVGGIIKGGFDAIKNLANGGGGGGGDTGGVEQHAAGGVYTKPTLLGNHLVAEAGYSEAIIPLKQSVLATMGAGMAAAYADAGGTMGRTTVNNYYLNNAVVNQDREIQQMFTKLMNEIRRKGGM